MPATIEVRTSNEKLQRMYKMWQEVMEDNEGLRAIDFVEVYGSTLEYILGQLAKQEKTI